jgi:hypothetical protein
MRNADEQVAGSEKPVLEAPLPDNAFTVPASLRKAALWVIGTIFVLLSVLLVLNFVDTGEDKDPSKMEIVYLLVGFGIAFGICNLEWEKFQFRITKIGPVEFHNIVSAQAEERDAALNEVGQHIKKLEKQIRESALKANIPAPEMKSSSEDLKKELAEFLMANSHAAYSPLRIRNMQHDKFAEYEVADIHRALREMVAEGTVTTRVSQKGNTLYRMARE